jgi:hypothetical protein
MLWTSRALSGAGTTADMVTIAYDQPVKDLIDALSRTGHVTHVAHRKDMVTIHHNGARLSHEGVLAVWQTRPASAHFDVDGWGDVAQYVLPNEFAWACGNTDGNQRSISIEMCNSALGGDWPVSEVTWREAARLTGWIFAKIIGARPTSRTVVPHHYWKATTCAGPFIDRMMAEIVWLAQLSYDYFTGAIAPDQEEPEDMTTRLVRGDSLQVVPGKSYNYGMLNFLVKTDTTLPEGAERKYMPAGGVQRSIEKMQGGVDVLPQADLDDIPFAAGGEIPASVLG